MAPHRQPIGPTLSLVTLLVMSSVVLPFLHALEHTHEDIPRHTETAEHVHTEATSYTGALPLVDYHAFACVYCQPHLLYLPSPSSSTVADGIPAPTLRTVFHWRTSAQLEAHLIRGPPHILG